MPSKFLLSTAEKIRDMRIRGASKIARAAAEAMMEEASLAKADSPEEFAGIMRYAAGCLLQTRPTAVSLPNAIEYIMAPLEKAFSQGSGVEELRAIVRGRAKEFVENSVQATKKIGVLGAELLGVKSVVMTHCHSTAVVSIFAEARKQGKFISAFVKETRPRYQGHITARQLSELGVKVNLIVDSAALYYMDRVDAVLVGADAIAMDGSVANKIGTRLTALAAAKMGKPVHVAAETYKIALKAKTGSSIPIEMRSPLEVVPEEFVRENRGIEILNPSFDVTEPEMISDIVTEAGVLSPPFSASIMEAVSRLGY
ncbi:MAG: ribose 1,5-bisphosphate isomerase [Candidatus Brockarchaeota archaeon]|nr:ribose 1,5-bisphosphate isomerase [Candidatus Brockarchaeota archaeon]